MRFRIAKEQASDPDFVESGAFILEVKDSILPEITEQLGECASKDSVTQIKTVVDSLNAKLVTYAAKADISVLEGLVAKNAQFSSETYATKNDLANTQKAVTSMGAVTAELKKELSALQTDLSGFKESNRVTPKKLREGLLTNGVFNLAAPMNIANVIEVENKPVDEGTIYFDIINQRLRVRTSEGWKTVKLV